MPQSDGDGTEEDHYSEISGETSLPPPTPPRPVTMTSSSHVTDTPTKLVLDTVYSALEAEPSSDRDVTSVPSVYQALVDPVVTDAADSSSNC